jgi:hypothetical protein
MSSQIKQVAATGDITTVSTYLKAVSLTGGSDAATLTVKAGGSGGTTILVLKAATATSVVFADLHDADCSGGVHATLAGTAPSATFVYE